MPDPIASDHFVNIGPRGTFEPSGAVQSEPADVDRILENVREHPSQKVAIHFHGGLVSEAKGLELAARLIPTYEAGGAYPITVVWESGLVETVKTRLAAVNETRLFNKLVNYAIRHAAKWLGASVGARGAGEPMSIAEIETARASDAEMDQMDARARGPGGVQTEEDVEAAAPEIESSRSRPIWRPTTNFWCYLSRTVRTVRRSTTRSSMSSTGKARGASSRP